MPYDLVDEMQWEDLEEFLTLEEAGLENDDADSIMSAQWEGYYLDEDGIHARDKY